MEHEVLFTPEAARWYRGLGDREAGKVDAALELLASHGSGLGRPLVDRIHGARHHKMKELRPPSSSQRALFAFDSHGTALILAGGDKAGEWDRWYARALPVADRRLEQHERRIGGGSPCLTPRAGARSATRER